MLQVLLFSVLASSTAFTTHRYEAYSLSNYRPNVHNLDTVFVYVNDNDRRPGVGPGVVISDVLEGPVNSDSARRRVDTHYQNPYPWNRQVPWIRVSVTEPTKLYNRFDNPDQNENVDKQDNVNKQPIGQQEEDKDTNKMNGVENTNKTEGSVNVPHISTQSDDVNRSLDVNERRITWNNDHGSSQDNANVTTRSINSDNTNSLNAFQSPDKINRPNNRTVNTVTENTNDNSQHGTKTTRDNEVSARPNKQSTKAEDDRWIWSNGEDQAVETTTLLDLDDRAAFAGDGCPSGKVKLGHLCVAQD